MNAPEWIKPGIWGAVVGAVAVTIVGFTWGGWMTTGSAEEVARTRTEAAVTMALVPYCVALARQDPDPARLTKLVAETSSYSSRRLVADFGWATALGADAPNTPLAAACAEELRAVQKS
jgi:alpha/beta superfamily hydrolase